MTIRRIALLMTISIASVGVMCPVLVAQDSSEQKKNDSSSKPTVDKQVEKNSADQNTAKSSAKKSRDEKSGSSAKPGSSSRPGSDSKNSPPDRPLLPRRKTVGKQDSIRDLTFDNLKFDIETGETFERSMLTKDIKDYHGTKIRLRGYIRPNERANGISKFIFVRDDKECCFGPGAALYDSILVKLKKGTTTDYVYRPVTVEGLFYVKEYKIGGTVMSIYRMKNAKVK